MNFFMTGDGSVKANVNLSLVTPAGSHGANFAGNSQSLRQSLSIAQNVFARVKRGKINFVLIGLAPDVLFRGGSVDENFDALTEYVKLCADNGAKAVAVILPVAPSVRDRYRQKFVTPLCEILSALKNLYDFITIDLFDLTFPEECFADERHFTSGDVPFMSAVLMYKLYERKIFSFDELCRMSYECFYELSRCLTAESFHVLLDKIFRTTVDELKRKDKIKVAFVTDHAATWCGDELYHMFANNPRFETTIFLCRSDESTLDDIRHDFEQFKSRGLNVVGVFEFDNETPPQDVIIFLRPYQWKLCKSLQSAHTTPKTLWTYIPYGFKLTESPLEISEPVFRLAWKIFCETAFALKFFEENCAVGIYCSLISGYPKMDVFFDTVKNFSFPWKMVRPDAKKIIWAPHWSFDERFEELMATFQHNYKFMYEFAKSHPETSWVVKPHPFLASTAVKTGLFPSDEAFKDYMRAWNDLPNAQVFTGGYYQDIFATSDGMIQDSCSFLAEYQYTHKPMIFLTREGHTKFNELGKKLLDVSYRVDGQDFDGIAVLLHKVFIDGDDPLKDARRQVFDELLNYRRVNNISATEYIFHAIADELTGD